jgi:hypothetical protein
VTFSVISVLEVCDAHLHQTKLSFSFLQIQYLKKKKCGIFDQCCFRPDGMPSMLIF